MIGSTLHNMTESYLDDNVDIKCAYTCDNMVFDINHGYHYYGMTSISKTGSKF